MSPQTDLLTLRVFLSSPGDTGDERGLTRRVLGALTNEPQFRGRVHLEEVSWDNPGATTPLAAHLTPQDAINQVRATPAECDIVIVMMWSRMGTPLPPDKTKADGTPYMSGTEWEFQNAIDAAIETDRPKVLVYRRTEPVILNTSDPDVDEKMEQSRRVEQFFASFRNPDGSLRYSYHEYDTPSQFAEVVEDHIREVVWSSLHEQPVEAGESEQAATWEATPYPGLRAFTGDESAIFFGRERDTDEVLRIFTRSTGGFAAVIGPSGSGKSSLVGAGVIPRLQGGAIENSEQWCYLGFKPGEDIGGDPLLALATHVASALPNPGLSATDLTAEWSRDPRAVPASICALLLAERPRGAEVLLFVDQFEELFTMVREDCRAPFVEFIEAALSEPRLHTILTLRSDFFTDCVRWPALLRLLQSGYTYPLGLPSGQALADIIVKPARAAGLQVDADLVDQILLDVGTEVGALAVLQFALSRLYEERTSGTLTLEAYRAMNGVQGAIDKLAQQTVRALDPDPETMKRVFQSLVEIEDAKLVRKRSSLEDCEPAAAELVTKLADARLLVISGDESDASFEVAHEAVLSHWKELRDWIETNRDFIAWRQRMKPYLDEFLADSKNVLRGRLLSDSEGYLQEYAYLLSGPEKDLIQASVDQRRRGKVVRYASYSLVVLVVLLAGFVATSQLRAWRLRQPIEPEMEPIPAGTFVMGADISRDPLAVTKAKADSPEGEEGPTREVKVAAFKMGKREVTFREYERYARAEGKRLPSDQTWTYTKGYDMSYRPVMNVTYTDATGYAEWLSKKLNRKFRLPTEAEWEYAARGGTETRFFWGDDPSKACEYANIWSAEQIRNAENDDYTFYWGVNEFECSEEWLEPAPTNRDSVKPNNYGLVDMLGNVQEFVADCWNISYEGAPATAEARTSGNCTKAPMRGGSWGANAQWARVTSRLERPRGNGNHLVGFRIAEDLATTP